MGDAPAATASTPKDKPSAKVALRIRANAHVDVADLSDGRVSKTSTLVVPERDARRLLQQHPYLEATEG
jgi:hypothetical protein